MAAATPATMFSSAGSTSGAILIPKIGSTDAMIVTAAARIVSEREAGLDLTSGTFVSFTMLETRYAAKDIVTCRSAGGRNEKKLRLPEKAD